MTPEPNTEQPKVHAGFGESMYCDCGGTWVEGHEESHLEGCPLKQPTPEQPKREAWEEELLNCWNIYATEVGLRAYDVQVKAIVRSCVSVARATQQEELERVRAALAAVVERKKWLIAKLDKLAAVARAGMPEPYATAVFDIVANGQLDPLVHPQIKQIHDALLKDKP